ncbi:MAG: TrkH family potassium uptake protein [Bacteroidales bacterium]|nr:TrkH family potassium uptake protein [Bacteroidales bacterium]
MMSVKAISLDIGKALQINALFMLLSLGVSVACGFDSGFTPLLISFLITSIAGSFPLIFVRESHQQVTPQEGFITIVMAWLLSFIFGMLPYVLWGGEFTLMNAWFESVSGYTTTGSTILSDVEALPKSLLMWRSSTHYIGGLGVVVFLLLILPDTSTFKFKLSHLELSSIAKEGYRYKSGKTVRIITLTYIGLTIAEFFCLWAAGMTPFDAINHSFSTIATGGFSTKNTSILFYDSTAINIIIMVFMALASMHFGVIFASLATRSFKPLKHPITRYYFLVILILSLLATLSLSIQGGLRFPEALMSGSFQVISFISTTGFGQADNAMWPVMANAILLFAGFHCGCAGSTTGGIKADRMYISLKAIAGDFRKRLSQSAIIRVRVGETCVEEDTVASIFLFIVLYIMVLFLSFVAVLFCGVDIAEAFSGTLASLGNVGPGLGTLGTMGNYASQPEVAKFIYTMDMFLGRLEIFPVLVVMSLIFKKRA